MQPGPPPPSPDLPGRGPAAARCTTRRAGGGAADRAGDGPGMYVCGITPYDATHLGHAATYLAFDLVNRVWRDAGHDVHYVQNVTDIDDPLLERASRDGEDWQALAVRETALFREDMAALRVLPPDALRRRGRVDPGRSSTAVVRLLRTAAAYRLDDGTATSTSSVAADPALRRRVATCDRATMLRAVRRARRRPRPAGQEGPARRLLWRGARDRRAGLGRPARARPARAGTSSAPPSRWTGSATASTCRAAAPTWCSRTTRCRAAHAEVLTGRRPFARHYVHAGMVGLDGEKM